MVGNLLDNFTLHLAQASPFAFLAAYLGGVLISFTSCVYPVLPLTVAFVGARSAGSQAKGFFLSLLYVLGLSVTYTALGGMAAFSGRLFGQIQASPISNLLLGNLCLFMGLSLMGVFSFPFKVPRFLSRLEPLGKRKDGLASFVVGMASGLVVGPCTAPVLATLLAYVATRQNVLFGMGLLFVFAFGMGTLLIALGTFAGLLAALPKGGKWLSYVNYLFGLILVFMAEYFLVKAGMLWI